MNVEVLLGRASVLGYLWARLGAVGLCLALQWHAIPFSHMGFPKIRGTF